MFITKAITYYKMTKGSKQKLHQSTSEAGSPSPAGSRPGLHRPRIDNVFRKHQQGDKEKDEYIEMYSTSVGKYNMRANTRKGLIIQV